MPGCVLGVKETAMKKRAESPAQMEFPFQWGEKNKNNLNINKMSGEDNRVEDI